MAAADPELEKIAQSLQGAKRYRINCLDCKSEWTGYARPSAPPLECAYCGGFNTNRHMIGPGILKED
jgi:rRNA maturation endonuclease Nob1